MTEEDIVILLEFFRKVTVFADLCNQNFETLQKDMIQTSDCIKHIYNALDYMQLNISDLDFRLKCLEAKVGF